jgi:hypothetical protein
MLGIVAAWRCKCGLRIKVIAEADINQPISTVFHFKRGTPRVSQISSSQGDKISYNPQRLVVADYENTIEQNQLRLLYPSGSVNVTRDLEWR